MTDRPILFSGPMVRALLHGRKTQTRRVLKVQPHIPPELHEPVQGVPFWCCFNGDEIGYRVHVPFASGDRLWVREAHAILPASAYRGSVGTGTIAQTEHPTDGYSAALFREGFDRSGEPRWRPSIHMPRWASRLTLTVTDVRVQRLQDIHDADCRAEGCSGGHDSIPGYGFSATPGEHFRWLWDSLNADRAPWASNPWVCAVSFAVQKCNIDRVGEAA